jgi:hypothetical protein
MRSNRNLLLLPFFEVFFISPQALISPLQERMAKQLFAISSNIRVLIGALLHEISEVPRPPFAYRNHLIVQYFIEDCLLLLLDVGRLTLSHFYCEDAKGPDVDLCVVFFFTADHLRGHPADGTNFALAFYLLDGKLAGVTEVGELDLAV